MKKRELESELATFTSEDLNLIETKEVMNDKII